MEESVTEPITGGGAALVAESMIKEVKAAAQPAEQLARNPQSPAQSPGTEFAEVLATQRVSEHTGVTPSRVDVLRVARHAHAVPRVPANPPEIPGDGWASGIQRIMDDVMQGQNKLEELMGLALSGRDFSMQELLAMQAGVYRFTQELELTSKVVEKATSTVRQTMNTQV